MAASQHTANYNLPVYEANDIPQYMGESDSWNSTMQILDTAIKEASESGGGGGGGSSVEVVQTTGTSTTAVMSQNAVSEQLSAVNTQISGVTSTVAGINTNVTELSTKVTTLEDQTADIPNVVQSTGDSTTAVMSQKAVSDALAGAGGGMEIAIQEGTITNSVSSYTTAVSLNLKPGNYLIIASTSYQMVTGQTSTSWYARFEGILNYSSFIQNATGLTDTTHTMVVPVQVDTQGNLNFTAYPSSNEGKVSKASLIAIKVS